MEITIAKAAWCRHFQAGAEVEPNKSSCSNCHIQMIQHTNLFSVAPMISPQLASIKEFSHPRGSLWLPTASL
jgi:hypothetical protein